MGKELQERILDALNKLIEGAPEAWIALCEEVVARGYVHLAFLVMVGLFGLACAGTSIFFGKKANWNDCENGEAWASIIFAIVSIITIVVTLCTGYSVITEVTAPSLFLLGR